MATLTAPKKKVFKPKTVSAVPAPEMSEDELWEKATAAMQQMALNATALADTAQGLVQKLDVINARLDRKLKHPVTVYKLLAPRFELHLRQLPPPSN